VRTDKLTLAALQDVAFAYLAGDATRIPLWRMALTSTEALRARAERIAARVGDRVKVVDTEAVAGGGALPGLTIPSIGVAVEAPPTKALPRLRTAGVVARAEERSVVCDLRTVDPDDDDLLAAVLAEVVPPPGP
jgi:L-seryl-tRNA(Ser) seleniumtransferase